MRFDAIPNGRTRMSVEASIVLNSLRGELEFVAHSGYILARLSEIVNRTVWRRGCLTMRVDPRPFYGRRVQADVRRRCASVEVVAYIGSKRLPCELSNALCRSCVGQLLYGREPLAHRPQAVSAL